MESKYDVGSSYPGGGEASKGLAVRQLKGYASWVQNVVRQFGPNLLWAWKLAKDSLSYERTEGDQPLVCQLSYQRHCWVAMLGSDKR